MQIWYFMQNLDLITQPFPVWKFNFINTIWETKKLKKKVITND